MFQTQLWALESHRWTDGRNSKSPCALGLAFSQGTETTNHETTNKSMCHMLGRGKSWAKD